MNLFNLKSDNQLTMNNTNTKIKTTKIIEPTVKPPKIEVDKDLLESIKTQFDVEKQIVLHCYLNPESLFTQIRIWESTFLYDLNSNCKAKLLQPFGIPLRPEWLNIMGTAFFVLVFESLPNSVQIFKMEEHCSNGIGFHTKGINRNESDIYRVRILY